MKFSIISSGSKANCTYLEEGQAILIDCGLSGKMALDRIAQDLMAPGDYVFCLGYGGLINASGNCKVNYAGRNLNFQMGIPVQYSQGYYPRRVLNNQNPNTFTSGFAMNVSSEQKIYGYDAPEPGETHETIVEAQFLGNESVMFPTQNGYKYYVQGIQGLGGSFVWQTVAERDGTGGLISVDLTPLGSNSFFRVYSDNLHD